MPVTFSTVTRGASRSKVGVAARRATRPVTTDATTTEPIRAEGVVPREDPSRMGRRDLGTNAMAKHPSRTRNSAARTQWITTAAARSTIAPAMARRFVAATIVAAAAGEHDRFHE